MTTLTLKASITILVICFYSGAQENPQKELFLSDRIRLEDFLLDLNTDLTLPGELHDLATKSMGGMTSD